MKRRKLRRLPHGSTPEERLLSLCVLLAAELADAVEAAPLGRETADRLRNLDALGRLVRLEAEWCGVRVPNWAEDAAGVLAARGEAEDAAMHLAPLEPPALPHGLSLTVKGGSA